MTTNKIETNISVSDNKKKQILQYILELPQNDEKLINQNPLDSYDNEEQQKQALYQSIKDVDKETYGFNPKEQLTILHMSWASITQERF